MFYFPPVVVVIVVVVVVSGLRSGTAGAAGREPLLRASVRSLSADVSAFVCFAGHRNVTDPVDVLNETEPRKRPLDDLNSGSPIYHCTGGTCSTGEIGRVDIVHAGWNGAYVRQVGARVVNFRTQFLGYMN
jgi:hypothetical protein